MAFTAVVLLAIFLRVIRVEFPSSSVQISSAGFQALVSWDSSKPMVADESEDVEFFVKGVPDSGDSGEVFFSHSVLREPAGNTVIYAYDAAGDLPQLGANIWEIDASGTAIPYTYDALNQLAGIMASEALINTIPDTDSFAFAAEVSSLQTVRDHRDNCRTPTGHNGLVNRISLGVGEIGGVSLAWTPSPVSDTVELLACELGQLLSLFTDRSAKERLTSSVVVQQNQDAPPIFLIGGVLFPPSFVPAFFLWIQPAVFSSPLIVFAILKIPILGLLHDTSTSSDLDGVVPRPGALSA